MSSSSDSSAQLLSAFKGWENTAFSSSAVVSTGAGAPLSFDLLLDFFFFLVSSAEKMFLDTKDMVA